MTIHYEPGDDHIVRVTIDRPEARNSLDMDHFKQLRMAWDRFGEDDDAYVAIITGVGSGLLRRAPTSRRTSPRSPSICRRRCGTATWVSEVDGYRLDDGVEGRAARYVTLYKPIIAAINGNCVAGGMEMLGGCDLRVASRHRHASASWSQSAASSPVAGTTVRLPRQVPYPAAMELLLMRRPGVGRPTRLRNGVSSTRSVRPAEV